MLGGSITNRPAIQIIERKVMIRRDMIILNVGNFARELSFLIRDGLDHLLATGGSHFEVMLHGNQSAYSVRVESIDEIGNFMYTGTVAHDVHPTNKIAMASDIGNLNPLIHPVSGVLHIPAQKGHKQEIDDMIATITMAFWEEKRGKM